MVFDDLHKRAQLLAATILYYVVQSYNRIVTHCSNYDKIETFIDEIPCDANNA